MMALVFSRPQKKRFDWADSLALQIRALKLPEPTREYEPITGRKFRLDVSWPEILTFCEVDGAEWSHGRHGRGYGMQADCEKWNLLTLAGWTGFRFTGSQVRSGYAIKVVEQIFQQQAGG